jgi:hypothetical protein
LLQQLRCKAKTHSFSGAVQAVQVSAPYLFVLLNHSLQFCGQLHAPGHMCHIMHPEAAEGASCLLGRQLTAQVLQAQ